MCLFSPVVRQLIVTSATKSVPLIFMVGDNAVKFASEFFFYPSLPRSCNIQELVSGIKLLVVA